MLKELTMDQARANAQNFMYIFAPDSFLNAIPKKYANEISKKAKNQHFLLAKSADKYGTTYQAYENAVRDGFIATYGMTPYDALITLANGGQVAGKNWKAGIYGVGAVKSTTFNGITLDGQTISVDPETGHIFKGSIDITDTSKTIYETIKGNTVAYQLLSGDSYKQTFVSQYNKNDGKYYAASYVDGEGTKHNASGAVINNSDSATVWESVFTSIKTFLDWLLSLFGYNSSTTINEENTLPNQKTDGFVYESGLGEMGVILLATAAGALILGTSGKGKKKK